MNSHNSFRDIKDEEGKKQLQITQNPSNSNKEKKLELINPTWLISFHMTVETDFFNSLNNTSITLAELEKLLLSPIPRSLGGVQLCIKKDNSGIFKNLYPEYKLYLKTNNRFIMIGKRMQLMGSAYYLITAEVEVTNRKSPGCLGKLRSNFQETEFDLFGTGENLKKRAPFEQVHAAIVYNLEENKLRGYNKMDVLVPKPSEDNEPYNFKHTTVHF
jgi:hypothetical protein